MTTMIMSGRLSSRYLRLGLSLVGLVLAAQALARGWAINLWSLQVLKSRMGAGSPAGPAPDGHRRAALWQAQEALAAGDAQAASGLLEPPVGQGDPLVLSIYGQALARQAQREQAVQLWEQVSDFNSLRDAAQEWAAAGLSEETNLAFQKAYNIHPEEIINDYADFLYELQRDEDGEKILMDALDRFQSSHYRPQWQERLGNHLRMQGRLVEAETIYKQALEETPDRIYLITGLGRVHADLGERDRAAELFEQAMYLYPEEGDGYYEMGLLLAREEQYGAAEVYLEQAMKIEPQRLNYCMGRGNIAIRSGNSKLAFEVFGECIQRFPQDGRPVRRLARTLYELGQSKDAQSAIEKGLNLPPDVEASDWVLAGLIYESNGEIEQSIEAFTHAISLDPQNQVALDGVLRLGTR